MSEGVKGRGAVSKAATDDRPLVLRVLFGAGHHATQEQEVADTASEWAFVLQALRRQWQQGQK